MLAIGSCLLDWATPPRSLAAIEAGAHASHMDGDQAAVAAAAREAANAVPLQGTDAPLHGVWVLLLAALGAGVTATGAAFARDAARRVQAEATLRGAGVVLGLGVLVVLMDAGADVYRIKTRAAGLWLTAVFLLAACLCATFASTKLPPPPEA